jgi:prepilin peptidase CpaA
METTIFASSLALAAGIVDARSGRIPNGLTFFGMFLGLAWATWHGGYTSLATSACGLVLCGGMLALPFFLTRGEAMGGGDVKCWAALGSLLGPGLGLSALLAALSILAFLGLCREAYRGRLAQLLGSLVRVALCRPRKTEPSMAQMRFGPSIALGTLMTLFPELSAELARLW